MNKNPTEERQCLLTLAKPVGFKDTSQPNSEQL